MSLWRSQVPRRDVFTLDLTVQHAGRGGQQDTVFRSAASSPIGAGNPAGGPLKLAQSTIWHQLELSNTGNKPWTTGAAMLMQGDLPLGQDVLAYTSPGARVMVPVTVAPDLQSTQQEQEVDRTPTAAKVDGITYAHIHKRGSIVISSYRPEKSTVKVTLALGGKLTAASDDGVIRIDELHAGDWSGGAVYPGNNHSEVSWEVVVGKNASRTLTYDVELFE